MLDEDDKRELCAIIYWLVVSCIYLVGSIYLLNDVLFEYIRGHIIIHAFLIFTLIGMYIIALLYGMNKILRSKWFYNKKDARK
jgi:hypothetical protein